MELDRQLVARLAQAASQEAACAKADAARLCREADAARLVAERASSLADALAEVHRRLAEQIQNGDRLGVPANATPPLVLRSKKRVPSDQVDLAARRLFGDWVTWAALNEEQRAEAVEAAEAARLDCKAAEDERGG